MKEQILQQAVDYSNDTQNEILANDLKQLISCAMQQLTPRQRKIFEMSREQQMSHKEIADVLGISVNTVQESISTSLRTLRFYLKKNFMVVQISFYCSSAWDYSALYEKLAPY